MGPHRIGWIKKLISYPLLVCFLFFSTANVSGHEMWTEGHGTTYPVRWSVMSNGKVNWKIYNLDLGTPYSSYFNTASYAWKNACPNEISASTTSYYSSANIVILSPSKDQWKALFEELAPVLLGYCENRTSDGVFLNTLEDVKRSNKKISFAKIYLTPNTNLFSNQTNHVKSVMVHELGHALGLGHPGSTSIESIMQQNAPTGWYTPKQHDKQDVASWY